ncbi:MAG: polysaccharide deacetylase family protein [Methanosarcinaceae archaeon]|nr:polysaccharide deacetylase family protein [Methanosarcinaceae archaeon]
MTIEYNKLIEGRYEAERLPKDFSSDHFVPDFAFNVLNPLGLLYRPVVDENYLENGGKWPVWPDGKTFAVCLTHDVDYISTFSFFESLRKKRIQFAKQTSIFKKIRLLLSYGADLTGYMTRFWSTDILLCHERWIEKEMEVGAHSTFFFWPGWSNVTTHHQIDPGYDLFDAVTFEGQKISVAEMIREIDRRGWEIGLHPSWYSFDNLEEIKRQKEALESALGHDIVSVRQHYLHYDIRITPRIHARAGFKYDSTLGFNDNVGFRFGTSYPWFLFDLKSNEELPVMEIPLIVQDGALLSSNKGLRLDEDTAFEYVIMIADAVEKVSGTLTLLWHSHHIIDQHWWRLYLRILRYLRKKNAWFGSVREVGEWWKREECNIKTSHRKNSKEQINHSINS